MVLGNLDQLQTQPPKLLGSLSSAPFLQYVIIDSSPPCTYMNNAGKTPNTHQALVYHQSQMGRLIPTFPRLATVSEHWTASQYTILYCYFLASWWLPTHNHLNEKYCPFVLKQQLILSCSTKNVDSNATFAPPLFETGHNTGCSLIPYEDLWVWCLPDSSCSSSSGIKGMGYHAQLAPFNGNQKEVTCLHPNCAEQYVICGHDIQFLNARVSKRIKCMQGWHQTSSVVQWSTGELMLRGSLANRNHLWIQAVLPAFIINTSTFQVPSFWSQI